MNFTSLCYIPSKQPNGQYWLQRIAEWNGSTLVPFNTLVPFTGKKHALKFPGTIDRFPCMEGQLTPRKTGEIGIYDWTGEWNPSLQRTDVSNVRYRDDLHFYQVVSVPTTVAGTDSERVCAIADWLRKNRIFDYTKIYVQSFLARVSKGSCLLLARDMFDPDGKLKTDILSAPLVALNKTSHADVWAVGNVHVVLDYCAMGTIGVEISSPLYMSMDLIRNLIVKKVSWPVVKGLGFTKVEKKTFDTVLQKIDLHPFVEELAQELGSSSKEAELELKRFRENANQIDILSGHDGLLMHFFEHNDDFREMCIAEGERRWREQNESVIQKETEKKNAVLSDLGRKIELCETKLQEQEKNLEENDGLIREQENEIRQKKDELSNAETAVKERLTAIRADIPKAFAEMSVLKHLFEGTSSVRSPSGYTRGVAARDAIILGDAKSAWEQLWKNLKKCGCSDTKAQTASLWILACVIRRQPLLLVGTAAESFARAIAQSLLGMRPAVLDCVCQNVMQAEDNLVADAPAACIVRSPFAADWVSRLPGLFSRASGSTLFLGITPFHEDLVVEPPSFFHTMLPFLTDVFCDAPTSIAETCFASGKINFSEQTWRQLAGVAPLTVKYANDLRLTSIANTRIGGIIGTMSQVEKGLQPFKEGQQAGNVGAFLPLAVATGRKELVETLVKSVNESWGLSSYLA